MQLLLLLTWALLPGCGAVKGPSEVRGFLGGSLSVTCTYEPHQKELPKFWCRPGKFWTCGEIMVITSESDREARKGRFSIRDNRTHRAFTVTVGNLSKEDEGTFLCGVQRTFWPDGSAYVQVIVNTGHTQTISQGEIVQSTSNPSTPQVLNVVEHILTPAVIVVLFLLLVAAGVLVILSRKKKALSSADIEMDRTRSMSPTDAEALNYADINHGMGVAESQYSNVQAGRPLETPPMEYVEVRKSAQPLEEEKDALYAKVQKPKPQQDQIYANVPSALQHSVGDMSKHPAPWAAPAAGSTNETCPEDIGLMFCSGRSQLDSRAVALQGLDVSLKQH